MLCTGLILATQHCLNYYLGVDRRGKQGSKFGFQPCLGPRGGPEENREGMGWTQVRRGHEGCH